VDHDQFAGHWPVERKVTYLLQGTGSEGRSLEYLSNIVEQLGDLGISDEGLEALLSQARQTEAQ